MERSYCQQGRYKEAIEKYLSSMQIASRIGREEHIEAFIGYTYAKSGERDKARQILNKLIEKEKIKYIPPVDIALIYNGLRENDNVFKWFEIAYEKRDFVLLYIKVWPEFQNLRSDQRYNTLLRKIGLIE